MSNTIKKLSGWQAAKIAPATPAQVNYINQLSNKRYSIRDFKNRSEASIVISQLKKAKY